MKKSSFTNKVFESLPADLRGKLHSDDRKAMTQLYRFLWLDIRDDGFWLLSGPGYEMLQSGNTKFYKFTVPRAPMYLLAVGRNHLAPYYIDKSLRIAYLTDSKFVTAASMYATAQDFLDILIQKG